MSPVWVKNPAQLPSSDRLWPPEAKVPPPYPLKQLPPEGLFASRVFFSVTVPKPQQMPPPSVPELREKVLLVTFKIPVLPFKMAPPPPDREGAEFPEKVLLVTEAGPRL